MLFIDNSSVIRQKGESQNGCCKITKHTKFSEKRTFLTTWYVHSCAYQEARNVRFSENLAYLFSCYTRFEIRPFALLPTNYEFFCCNIEFALLEDGNLIMSEVINRNYPRNCCSCNKEQKRLIFKLKV